jgi:hypothetical protein
MRHSAHDQPAVITTAPRRSTSDEFAWRRKKYAILMGTRTAFIIAAALTYRISLILALALIIGGAVLPWCAVIIANDRPAKRRPAKVGHAPRNTERGLPSGTDRVVDG